MHYMSRWAFQFLARSCADWHAAQQRTNTMQQGPCSGVQGSMHIASSKGSPALQLVPDALQSFWLSPALPRASMYMTHATLGCNSRAGDRSFKPELLKALGQRCS